MMNRREFVCAAPYVRVFGNTLVKGAPRAPQLAYIARGLHELGAHAQPRGGSRVH